MAAAKSASPQSRASRVRVVEPQPGQVVRLPAGSDIAYGGTSSLTDAPTRTRKDRIGVVEYLFAGDGIVCFRDGARGLAIAHVDDVDVVCADDHRLTVTRRNLGGHPIAGWNWPVWGYDYRCACGADLGDREDHALHLREVIR